MKDSLLAKLAQTGIDILDFAKMSAIQIFKFIEKEAPLLLNEWMAYHFWTSLILFSIALLIFIVPMFYYRRIYKYNKTLKYNSQGFPWLITGFAQFIAFTLIVFNLEWIKILIAPRVWILENIKDLIS